MLRDPWARPHESTLLLDGEARRLRFARLSVGELANVRMLLAMFRAQQDRIVRIVEAPIGEQLDALLEERRANVRLGEWVEETLASSLRPATPWQSAEGLDVVDGETFVAAYQDRDLMAALMLLHSLNTPSETLRKNSPSPPGSGTGSPDASPGPRGDAPAPTVPPVDASDSAPVAGVTGPRAASPSGSTTSVAAPSPLSVLSAA